MLKHVCHAHYVLLRDLENSTGKLKQFNQGFFGHWGAAEQPVNAILTHYHVINKTNYIKFISAK